MSEINDQALNRRIQQLKSDLETATEKAVKLGIEKEEHFIYRLEAFDHDSNAVVIKTPMAQFRKTRGTDTTIVARFKLIKNPELIYCIDRDGDISSYPKSIWSELQRLRRQLDVAQ